MKAKSVDTHSNSQPEIETNFQRLADGIGKLFILAYKEDTRLLEETLTQAGFQCEVLRQQHQAGYETYSRSYLCLLNHRHAWERATQETQPTLVIEADFVPVMGFGQLPLPFDRHQANVGIAWLYTCAPQVYSVSKTGFAEGFSTAAVAYIVTPQSAACLLELAEEIKQKYGPTNYSAWDSTIDSFLRKRKFKNYIPFRNYGEHGGRPNPEHRQQGLSPAHRADTLYGRLAFLPPYAVDRGGWLKVLQVRSQARLKGLGRLVTGRFLRVPVIKGSTVPGRLIRFALRRQLSPWL